KYSCPAGPRLVKGSTTILFGARAVSAVRAPNEGRKRNHPPVSRPATTKASATLARFQAARESWVSPAVTEACRASPGSVAAPPPGGTASVAAGSGAAGRRGRGERSVSARKRSV